MNNNDSMFLLSASLSLANLQRSKEHFEHFPINDSFIVDN